MNVFKIQTGTTQHEVALDSRQFVLDGRPISVSVEALGQQRYHLLINGRSVTCEVLHRQAQTRKLELLVNNRALSVTVRSRLDELLDRMGMNTGGTQREQHIKAPMPGLVLSVLVQPGQSIEPGTSLLILEAMKMENIIKAHTAGVVRSVRVAKGEAVEKNQILLELE